MESSIIKLVQEPFPEGFMAFTVTKKRILNMHKAKDTIASLSRDAVSRVFTEAVQCGSMDVAIFMMTNFFNCIMVRGAAPPRMETQIVPGMVPFLHRLLPDKRFYRFRFTKPKWTFPAFGGNYPSMYDAVVACDPYAVINKLVFEAMEQTVGDDVVEALDTIPIDEMRHFFKWILWDWLPHRARVVPTEQYTPDGQVIV